MYHKFHLHFSSSQITFYPIRWRFLCWLKGTLKQTIFSRCYISSSLTYLIPISLTVLISPPLVGQSYLSYYFPSVCSSPPPHPPLLYAGKEPQCWTNNVQICCFCVQCLHTDTCRFFKQEHDFRLGVHISNSQPPSLVQTFYHNVGEKGRADIYAWENPTLILTVKHIYWHKRTLNYTAIVPPLSAHHPITVWKSRVGHSRTQSTFNVGRDKIRSTRCKVSTEIESLTGLFREINKWRG